MIDLLLPLVFRFSLVGSRLAGLLVTSPLMGSRLFPARVRVGTALVLALAFTAAGGPVTTVQVPGSSALLLLLVGRELLVGAALGFLVRMLVAAATMAGSLVGMQMGLGVANVMDPQSQVSVTQIGQVLGMVAVMALLAFDAHHVALAAVYKSFEVAPLGELSFGGSAVGLLMDSGSALFEAAVALAAPVIVAVFLANIGMALLARTVPQMNVFVVGFLLTMSVGFLVLGASAAGFVAAFEGYTDGLGGRLLALAKGL